MHAMIETCTPEDITLHMTFVPSSKVNEDNMDAPQAVDLCFPLLSALCSYIVASAHNLDLSNYRIYQEALKLLITLMGTQLGSNFAQPDSNRLSHRQVFLDALCTDVLQQESRYGDSIKVPELMSVLLNHVIDQRRFDQEAAKPSTSARSTPVEASNDVESGAPIEPPTSNSAWSAFVELGNFFAFPFQEFARMLITGDTTIPLSFAPIAELSICTILILVNHQTEEGTNPFRTYLSSLGSAAPPSASASSASITPSSSSSSIPLLTLPVVTNANTPSFNQLYQCITARISEDSMLVLLYMLLQNNAEFHRFIASRADLDVLLLPLLSNLYRAAEQTRVRVYTILILMTILTFDEHFVPAIQTVAVDTPAWFKEKYLPKLPLPELILLVLLRVLQVNLKAIHDPYLHDNCLACLGNLAGQLVHLRFYSAKNLVQTTNLFIARYSSMLGKSSTASLKTSSSSLPRSDGAPGSNAEMATFVAPSSNALPTPSDDTAGAEIIIDTDLITATGPQTGAELMGALQEMEGYIHTFLEVIDCLFRKKPSNHVQLIYAMVLDDKRYLQVLVTHPRLGTLAQQLIDFSEHFLRDVQAAQCDTPAQVVSHIANLALTWKPNPEPAPLADIKFAYQETNAAPFFTPYIWKLFLKRPFIYWNPTNIVLYSAGMDPNFAGDDEEEDPPRESFS